MTEIIYSTQKAPNSGGRQTRNPVHFVSPVEGVDTVYVQDGYPLVREAYERKGAKVKPLSELTAPKPAPAPAQADKKKE